MTPLGTKNEGRKKGSFEVVLCCVFSHSSFEGWGFTDGFVNGGFLDC